MEDRRLASDLKAPYPNRTDPSSAAAVITRPLGCVPLLGISRLVKPAQARDSKLVGMCQPMDIGAGRPSSDGGAVSYAAIVSHCRRFGTGDARCSICFAIATSTLSDDFRWAYMR